VSLIDYLYNIRESRRESNGLMTLYDVAI